MNRRDFIKGSLSCFGLLAAEEVVGKCGLIDTSASFPIKRGFYLRLTKFDENANGGYLYRLVGNTATPDGNILTVSHSYDGSWEEMYACDEVIPFGTTKSVFSAYSHFSKSLDDRYDDVSVIFYRGGEGEQQPYVLQSSRWERELEKYRGFINYANAI
jgi:hypothetical protein